MKLREFEGKRLFQKYNISVPRGVLLENPTALLHDVPGPFVIKAQVCAGDRKAAGGIEFCGATEAFSGVIPAMFRKSVRGEVVERVLVEERLDVDREYYLSLSYSTDERAPVLAFSGQGGSGIEEATLVPVTFMSGITHDVLTRATGGVQLSEIDRTALKDVAEKLWHLFLDEHALLAEINPLIKTRDGSWVAADAKVILDDEKHAESKRPFLSLGGDIAILASGGGASMLNIDSLMHHGGRPANYVEYSGNPPAEVVRELTMRVLGQPNLKGCWVIGGTANFTDIYETMTGFVDGLRALSPKPTFPIVIRRDGPRQEEAFAMLRDIAQKEGFQFYVFGSETPMEESARMMVKLAYS